MIENTLTTHLETGLIVVFYRENSMNHILDFDNIFLLPPGSFGGPDANL